MKTAKAAIISLMLLVSLLALPGVMAADSHTVHIYVYDEATLLPVDGATINVTYQENGTVAAANTTWDNGTGEVVLGNGTYLISVTQGTLEADFILILTEDDTNETIAIPLAVNSTTSNVVDWLANYPLTFSLIGMAILLGFMVVWFYGPKR